MLLSGANPNMRTTFEDNSPVLCIASKMGFTDMVSLLLEFNANVDAVSDTGMSALCYAASNGHMDILKMLYLRHARVRCFHWQTCPNTRLVSSFKKAFEIQPCFHILLSW